MLILAQRSPTDTTRTTATSSWPIAQTLTKVGTALRTYATEYKRAMDAAEEAERLSHALDKAAKLAKERHCRSR